ncbi:hypothetical protein F4805DRAFT_263130 [Annulohypoxylon moriforme]|nr:hypothetical protein F4805DRAFT_263130 [Annulohypoxylon moriforme]
MFPSLPSIRKWSLVVLSSIRTWSLVVFSSIRTWSPVVFSSIWKWSLEVIVVIIAVCLLAGSWVFWPIPYNDIFINILQRVVEEFEDNSQADFYSFLRVRQDSSGPSIHAAYMDEVHAHVLAKKGWARITLLGSVGFVLRDPVLRSKYDDMLRRRGRYLVPTM